MMRRAFGSAIVLAACAGLIGCGGPRQQQVSGTVTLDGQPVKSGHLRFSPTERTSSAEGLIQQGKYTLRVAPGKYKVEIYSPRSRGKGKRPAGPGADAEVFEETIPAHYNTRTDLTVEVTSDKKEYDFPLKSK